VEKQLESDFVTRQEGGRLAIWGQPSSGGTAVKLVDNLLESDFAVTRKGIYYVPRGPDDNPWCTSITFYDFATRTTTKIVDLKPHLGIWWNTRPSVSPDGRWLLYTQFEVETNDLMLVENFR
jgi:hypothetical protein